MRMNNASLTHADKNTHLKVIAVALLAGLAVAIIGLVARSDLTGGAEIARMDAKDEILRAGKPMAITAGEAPAIH